MPKINEKQLIPLLDAKSINVVKNVNTNNAWGFGGAIKNVYDLPDGLSVHVGTAYFRHLPKQKFVNLRNPNGSIVSESISYIHDHLSSL